jgi:hypothetical protein
MTKLTVCAAAIGCVLALSLMTSTGFSGTNYTAFATSEKDEKSHDDQGMILLTKILAHVPVKAF